MPKLICGNHHLACVRNVIIIRYLLLFSDLQWKSYHCYAVWLLCSTGRITRTTWRLSACVTGNFLDSEVVALIHKNSCTWIGLYYGWLLCQLFPKLRREGRVANVSDVVHRGQKVMVKVLSMAGSKISLSMKVNSLCLKPSLIKKKIILFLIFDTIEYSL